MNGKLWGAKTIWWVWSVLIIAASSAACQTLPAEKECRAQQIWSPDSGEAVILAEFGPNVLDRLVEDDYVRTTIFSAPVRTTKILQHRDVEVPPEFDLLQKSQEWLATNHLESPRRMENETAILWIQKTEDPGKYGLLEARSCQAP